MIKLNSIAMAVLGVAVGLGGGSGAYAKGHDQGVADGSPKLDPGVMRGGLVAGVDVPGVGGVMGRGFLGVAADLELDVNYGQDVVLDQVARGVRNVTPTVGNGKNATDR